MDNKQVQKSVFGTSKRDVISRPSILPIISVIIFVVFYVCPILKHEPLAHSCLAVLVVSGFCWASECIPSFVTAYLVPAACVWLRVGYSEDEGTRIPTKEWAVQLAAKFTDPVIFVFLGSLTMSTALAKLEVTDRASAFVLRRMPKQPHIVLLAIMLLNWAIGAFLSNVASTTLVLTFALPIIRSLDPDEPFIKALLFGICWSGNCGGMPTTIASPQNILALGFINEDHDHAISFLQWMFFGVPCSLLILLSFWVYLIIIYKPIIKTIEPMSEDMHFQTWTWKHTLTVVVTCVTILMWAVNETFETYLGHVGISSLLPVLVLFSTGILDGQDFGSLRWSTLVLMGGGLSLGEAMTKSKLLDILSDGITDQLEHMNGWVVIAIILFVVSIAASVINSTSAAAIFYPVLKKIGISVKEKSTMLCLSALMTSGAQLFHISSFPNALISGVQRHMKHDPTRLSTESFLTGTTFFVIGWPTVVMSALICLTVGFGITKAMKLSET